MMENKTLLTTIIHTIQRMDGAGGLMMGRRESYFMCTWSVENKAHKVFNMKTKFIYFQNDFHIYVCYKSRVDYFESGNGI